MDAQRAAGRSAGAYEEVDPYAIMVQQVEKLNRATRALSALHAQLLDQNAKVCLTASTFSTVMSAVTRVAAAGGAALQTL